MFDVLAGFYGTVVVEVGREVAVTANLCSMVGEQQEAEKGFKALFLCVGAGIGGMSGSVQASFVGNSYRRSVVAEAYWVMKKLLDLTNEEMRWPLLQRMLPTR